MRPLSETKARFPVEPKPATREPGTARLALASTFSRSARTPGARTFEPSGSVTTGTSGGLSPPLPYTRTISSLVSQPSRPGTLKRWSSASEAGPEAITPITVRISQPMAMRRL